MGIDWSQLSDLPLSLGTLIVMGVFAYGITKLHQRHIAEISEKGHKAAEKTMETWRAWMKTREELWMQFITNLQNGQATDMRRVSENLADTAVALQRLTKKIEDHDQTARDYIMREEGRER